MTRNTEKGVFASLMVLLLCLLATGCRKDLYYDGITRSVTIRVTWAATDTVPEGMRAIFYPTDGSTPHIYNIPVTGSTLTVPVGEYTVLLFNNDTEYTQLQNQESLSSIEAYTSLLVKAKKSKSFPEQNIVEQPDMFYTYLLKDFQVKEDLTPATIEATPVARVFDVDILVHVTGIGNVTSAKGYLSGIAGTYYPGLDSLPVLSSAIPFTFGQKGSSDYITTSVRVFGMSGTTPSENIFQLTLTQRGSSARTFIYSWDIADQLKADLKTHVVVTINDSTLVIPIPTDTTSSGFDVHIKPWPKDTIIPIIF